MINCIVLAAGYATRLYPITKNFPKPLLEVNKKPIIDWLLYDCISTKLIDSIIIVTNDKYFKHFENWKKSRKKDYLLNTVIEIINDGSFSNESRLGAVNDMCLGFSYMSNNSPQTDGTLVIAADNIIDFSFKGFINYYLNFKKSCVMCYYEDSLINLQKTGVVTFDKSNKIIHMEEKPIAPKSNWAVPPFYIYTPSDIYTILDLCKIDKTMDSPGTLLEKLSIKSDLYVYKMPGRRYDIGNIQNLQYVNKLFSKQL